MSTRSKAHSYPVQLVDLVLIELSNWRWSWRSIVVVSALVPLFSMVGLSVYARDLGSEALHTVFSGSLVMSLMFGNLGNIQSHLVFMRFQGTLEYFATLPIHKHTLMLAIIIAFFLLSFPALLTLLIIGSALLEISLAPHPLLLLVIPLCVLPMSAVGALIGVSVRNPQEGGSLSVLTTFLLAGLGPVLFPAERLPGLLNHIGVINPAARAASALRQTLIGPRSEQIALDLTILFGFTLCIFYVVGKKLDWRAGHTL
ncbi:MAG: ABC transporter permease [Anaerolineae bacterium]|nr:ABC transporter permease [Anaerolineae bacterium]